jgi:glycosyltransferase involved in cell wall biosynthesis
MKLISIIIPTYNRSNLLKITLDSLINQKYPKENFEIIISNNNSTDNTEDIIANFKQLHKNYNVIYYFEINQGVHYARNNAAKISKGDYLYFTDDDMILNENALLELIYLFNI